MSADPQEASPKDEHAKVLSNRVIAWSTVALTLVATGIAWPLLSVYGLGLEAIRTVGTIVLGAGGAVGLLLAARRQQTAERELVEKRRDLAHKERVQQHAEAAAADTLAQQSRAAEVSESDGAERRITELYAKAVEQLGSEKAPVRLGGLYALERLAQNTLSQRHTVVNVLCAYLRMPLDPARSPDGDESEVSPRYAQESQVRIAAQRILTVHLKPGTHSGSPADTFWPDIDLDLAGATLVDLRLERCRVRSADFSGATFLGYTNMGGTTFLERGEFDDATFLGSARFSEASFVKDAKFRAVRFRGPVRYRGTVFHRDARFTGTCFEEDVWFGDAAFRSDVWFTGANFERDVRFGRAVFAREARFGEVKFVRSNRERRKMFRGSWICPSSRSIWPSGWVLSSVTGEPWPDSGSQWQNLTPESAETAVTASDDA